MTKLRKQAEARFQETLENWKLNNITRLLNKKRCIEEDLKEALEKIDKDIAHFEEQTSMPTDHDYDPGRLYVSTGGSGECQVRKNSY